MKCSSYQRRAGKSRDASGRLAVPDAMRIYTTCIVAFVGILAMVSIAIWLMESVWHAAMVAAGIGALLYLRQRFYRVRHTGATWHRGHMAQATQAVPHPPVLSRVPNESTIPPRARNGTAKQGSIVYWGKQRVGWIDEEGHIHFDRTTRSTGLWRRHLAQRSRGPRGVEGASAFE